MKRVLTMVQRTLTANELSDFYDTARHRRAYFEAAGCRYWVFEQLAAPGTFLEFAEASDPDILAAALRAHADALNGPVYTEVETR
ncbi:MAG: hypothetical protein ACREOG_09170 [Gemmatimonadaceae bacterium]